MIDSGPIPISTGTPPSGQDYHQLSGTGTATGYAKTGYPLFYLWHVHDDYRVTNDGITQAVQLAVSKA